MLATIAKHFAWPDSDALMYFVRSQHQTRAMPLNRVRLLGGLVVGIRQS
jgi:hypothetical protein